MSREQLAMNQNDLVPLVPRLVFASYNFGCSQSGPSCSKLTTSLVNVSLKFQTLITQIHCYFLLKKCENPLHCK